jgi:dienelactone hydrolase
MNLRGLVVGPAARCITIGYLAVAGSGAHAASAEHIGAFIGRDVVFPPVLSPDGKHVASRVLSDGRSAVSVIRLPERTSVATIGMGDLAFSWVDWLDDETLLVEATKGVGFWEGDGVWDRLGRDPKIYRVDLKSPKPKLLFTTYKGVPKRVQDEIKFGSIALYPDAFDDRSGHMRVVMETGRRSLVMRYNPKKKLFTELGDIPGDIESEFSDREGRVFAAYGYPGIASIKHRDRRRLWYRGTEQGDWQVNYDGQIDAGSMDLIARGPKRNSVYLLEDLEHEVKGLSLLNLKTGNIESVFRAKRSDVWDYELDRDRTLFVIRHDDHFPQYVYPNPKHQAARLHVATRRAFPNQNVSLVSFSEANVKAIAQVASDRNPGTYYVVDVKTKRFQELSKQSAAVSEYATGSRNPIEFKARDGTRITGYVTLPAGQQEALPFVVVVKDGPGSRGATWDFDEEAQLFAGLGFGVLQVNYRGSTGFGRAFAMAGYGHWGDLIQDDIADGVRFVVKSGAADSRRICVMGVRFGAYAALMQTVREPTLYRCAVGIKGSYDLVKEYDDLRRDDFQDRYALLRTGHGTGRDELKQISPVNMADRIQRPVLFVEGKRSSGPMPEQARRMIRALKAAGVEHEVHAEGGSELEPLNHLNRRNAYGQIVEFIEKHTRVAAAGI